MSSDFIARLDAFARRLNWVNERICALLMAVLVLTVWLGVADRYAYTLGTTWTEEFARYTMIWCALLAVPVGAYRREHIGLEFVLNAMPKPYRRFLQLALDLVGLAFFLFLTYYSIGMTAGGKTQHANIFGMTMLVPFASVPVSSALTVIQLFVSMVRDFPLKAPEAMKRAEEVIA
ncbi:MAG: TRAP transporter small permease [Deltaproteobacteria bacterium]|nr:TRAP transporter small permease [Deltaproteobacteria bacterium]